MSDDFMWEHRMAAVCETASFLINCDVIDISFSNGTTREVYVAISKAQRAKGLSCISYVDLDGMLFYYDQPSFVPFTMAKMEIAIDIAWYDATGTLIKLASFEPGYAHPIFCPKAFSYVLEAPAGTIPQSNLKVRHG